jgi:hypothetical protein
MPLVLNRAQILGIIFGDECTRFLLEGDFCGAEFQLHHDSPKNVEPELVDVYVNVN